MAKMPLRFSAILIFSIFILLFICPVNVYSYNPTTIEEESLALQNLKTVFGHDVSRLTSWPETLEKARSDMTFAQDATMIIMDIQRNWEKWSPTFREITGNYFLIKSPLTHPSPPPFNSLPLEGGGIGRGWGEGEGGLSARKVVNGGHLLPNWVETANFSIEWGNNLTTSDGGKDSVRILDCSKRLTGLSSCTGIPDIVDSWADYFEEVWEKEIGTLGYIKPAGTPSNLYDVYIANTGDNIIGNDDDQTPTLGFDFWGLTATYCDNENFNPICKGDIARSYSYILVNNRITDSATMMVTAAHEFFHAIQFSYPTIDDWFSNNRWWLEATATWMEEVAYDNINSYYPRVRNWLKSPSVSLRYSGSRYSDHEYGDALFIIFMTDVNFKDTNLVRYVWENEKSGIEAINSVLMDKYQSDFDSAFKAFVALNAVVNRSGEWGGYEEGAQYGSAAIIKSHDIYPVPFFEISGENAPQELGSNYIQFTPPDNNDNQLVIEFDGSDSNNWAAMAVKVKSDGTGFEKEEVLLDSLQKYGCHSIDGFGTAYSEVFLVPVVLVDPSLVETASYHYRASINGRCDYNSGVYLVQGDSQSNVNESTSKDKRCFIATAAFGSSESPYVKILRDFRDKYLLPYSIGQRLVRLYYTVSPFIANFIERHPRASLFVRIALLPAIGIAFLSIKTTLLGKITLIISVLFLCLIRFFRNRQFGKLTK